MDFFEPFDDSDPPEECTSTYWAHYLNLNISQNSNAQEIKAAHDKLTRRLNPINFQDPVAKAAAEEAMVAVTLAYDVLSDPVKSKEWRHQNYWYIKGTQWVWELRWHQLYVTRMTRSPLEELARQKMLLLLQGIREGMREGMVEGSQQGHDKLLIYRPCKAMLVKLAREDTPEERITHVLMDLGSGVEGKVREIGDTLVINLFQVLFVLGILWFQMKSARRIVRSMR